MRSVYINLPTVEAVQRFVETISPLDGNFDLLSDGYILDARSLMGVLSLNLTQPMKLMIEKDSEETMRAIDRYITDSKASKAASETAENAVFKPVVSV